MHPIRILSTGGTFSKYYNPHTGTLAVDPHGTALREIAALWRTDCTVETLIGKDSLDMDDADRQALIAAIRRAPEKHLVIIHGTDTLDRSARAITYSQLGKCIVLTGAMVPYRIDPVEATANFAAAIGYIQGMTEPGVSVALNGCFGSPDRVIKDRESDRFVCV